MDLLPHDQSVAANKLKCLHWRIVQSRLLASTTITRFTVEVQVAILNRIQEAKWRLRVPIVSQFPMLCQSVQRRPNLILSLNNAHFFWTLTGITGKVQKAI